MGLLGLLLVLLAGFLVGQRAAQAAAPAVLTTPGAKPAGVSTSIRPPSVTQVDDLTQRSESQRPRTRGFLVLAPLGVRPIFRPHLTS